MRDPEITGVILAGGRGRRMGAQNKGLLTLGRQPLIAHVIARLSPQLAHVVISANDDLEAYRQFGLPVISDILPGYTGPLGGLFSVLQHTQSEWLLSVPCDTPALPADYVRRMRAAVAGHSAAVAHDGQRVQSGFVLVHRTLLPQLEAVLQREHFAVYRFLAEVGAREVDFSDQPTAFANINTPEQLRAYAQQLDLIVKEKARD